MANYFDNFDSFRRSNEDPRLVEFKKFLNNNPNLPEIFKDWKRVMYFIDIFGLEFYELEPDLIDLISKLYAINLKYKQGMILDKQIAEAYLEIKEMMARKLSNYGYLLELSDSELIVIIKMVLSNKFGGMVDLDYFTNNIYRNLPRYINNKHLKRYSN